MNDTDALLGPWLQRFLTQHVVTERNLSRNTCKSYRDSFKLLVPFACAQLGKEDYQLTVPDLSSELVRRFLDHLEGERGCCTYTRNLRLTAIRAFARFVASRDPAHVLWRGQISAISSKKTTSKPVPWLTVDEMHALLDVPDRSTRHGWTEHAILLFLYKSGARVSEATQLRVGDLQIRRRDGGHALVTLHGKGGKIRQCPLRPEIERVLAELVDGRADDDAVFLNRRRQPFTRFGVYSVVERCAAQVPALAGRKITPHVLRHTTASHLVFAGVDINTVRAWLGHTSIDTTNIYAEISLKMKAEAMALCDVPGPAPGPHWKEDRDLMAFLNSY
ncbi:MAG: tyrosine-type recombinase/integrase [Alphaproteobacteria bacterium]|nr:tyrosine-type recombinase/integrase [Alphaproteobacteria bacterium]